MADNEEDECNDMFCEKFKENFLNKNLGNSSSVKDVAVDSWDDHEGYYNTSNGEIINGTYEIKAVLGRGVFGSVFKATNISTNTDVAIKIIRRNMHQSGLKELGFLLKLQNVDPQYKSHVIKLIDHFEYRKHLCLVLELLNMNLRDLLKKYGQKVLKSGTESSVQNGGINIKAVKAYASQMFLALALLYKNKIIHCDIKPDNILVSHNHVVIKLCDLGTALNIDELKEDMRTPYLVSRYYRAPEIILGTTNFDYAIDMWSVGCTLYELYTGKILFPGRNNNEMLKFMMDYKGKFPNKLLRKGKDSYKYFDESDNFSFIYKCKDNITDKIVVSKLNITENVKISILSTLGLATSSQQEKKSIIAFADLLEKCFVLNPEKRLTWKEALRHPFIKN